MSDKQINFHQEKSTLLKEINFFFQSPNLSQEDRKLVNKKLKEIRDELKQKA